jgi:hypothetical protein
MSSENYMYIGPTVARIGLKGNTLVLGAEPPPQLKSLMELKPIIQTLFVPTSKVAEARRAKARRGTIEFMATEEILKYGREKSEQERKVQSNVRKEM